MRSVLVVICVALVIVSSIFTSCSSINKTQKSTVLGSAAGGALGAVIGKRAGNTAVGATIGAVIGASTGAFIGKRLDYISGKKSNKPAPLYVINGKVYIEKDARNLLAAIQPEKIERIEVLKTEEAIALYGNKGENGAVLVSVKDI